MSPFMLVDLRPAGNEKGLRATTGQARKDSGRSVLTSKRSLAGTKGLGWKKLVFRMQSAKSLYMN